MKRTALFSEHQRLKARLVDFAGWEMPVQYRSPLEEHRAVRTAAGMFDVSHMVVADLKGPGVLQYLRRMLANDVARLVDGKALYTCMLNPSGGVIDDLIVYRLGECAFRAVLNAGPAQGDLEWLQSMAPGEGVVFDVRRDRGILAVQGPQAREAVAKLMPDVVADAILALGPFHAYAADSVFVARTGYTGEDGFEVIASPEELIRLWRGLEAAGVRPCGLAARDTLRLEAGMNLYGQDMDSGVTPLECGLAWTVAWVPPEREFNGRQALEAQRAQPLRKQVGLVLDTRGVMRAHQVVRAANGMLGELTSGGYGATVNCSVALAQVPREAQGPYEVDIRGQWHPVREVRPPFVRNGKVLV